MQTEDKMLSQIYETDLYLYFMEKIYTTERSQKEANFLSDYLKIKPDHKILDVPCGYGRLSHLLAKKGFQVEGIDINEGFVREAKNKAKKDNLKIDYSIRDMRDLSFHEKFDFVFNIGTSFGVFTNEENRKILKGISDALKPGGKFCLEHFSPQYGEMVKRGMRRASVFEFENHFLLDRVAYHESSLKVEYKRTYLMEGKRSDAAIFIQLYSLEQLTILLRSVGLNVIDIYGNAKGDMFTKDSTYVLIIAEK